MATIKLSSLITDIRGKVGGQSFTRTRSGAVIRNKSNGGGAISPNRDIQRLRTGATSQAWRQLTFDQREAWNLAGSNIVRENRVGTQYSMSGFNYFNAVNNRRASRGLPQLANPTVLPSLPLIGNPELFWLDSMSYSPNSYAEVVKTVSSLQSSLISITFLEKQEITKPSMSVFLTIYFTSVECILNSQANQINILSSWFKLGTGLEVILDISNLNDPILIFKLSINSSDPIQVTIPLIELSENSNNSFMVSIGKTTEIDTAVYNITTSISYPYSSAVALAPNTEPISLDFQSVAPLGQLIMYPTNFKIINGTANSDERFVYEYGYANTDTIVWCLLTPNNSLGFLVRYADGQLISHVNTNSNIILLRGKPVIMPFMPFIRIQGILNQPTSALLVVRCTPPLSAGITAGSSRTRIIGTFPLDSVEEIPITKEIRSSFGRIPNASQINVTVEVVDPNFTAPPTKGQATKKNKVKFKTGSDLGDGVS